MKKSICILLCMIFLIGCSGADRNARLDVPTVHYQDSTDTKVGCLIEVPQILDSERKAVLEINAELEELAQTMKETYWGDEIMWCDVTAWPTETEQYISIVLLLREYPSYGTEGQIMSWVYDKQKGLRLTLDDALAMADTDMDRVKADIGRWCDQNDFVMTETDLTCFAFRMTADGNPQFMTGAVIVQEGLVDEIDPWASFFTWTDGEVVWTSSAPFDPAEVVGSFSNFLFCQTYESMNQYDGDPEHISEWEAMELFEEIYEINKYLEDGYEMRFDGNTVELDYETCICAVLGKEVNGEFVEEGYYAATWGCAYWFDPEGDAWIAVGFG